LAIAAETDRTPATSAGRPAPQAAAPADGISFIDIKAGISSLRALARYLAEQASPERAPVENERLQTLADAYGGFAQRLDRLVRQDQIVIAKPGKAIVPGAGKKIIIDATLGGTWQAAAVAHSRRTKGDTWRYDGIIAQNLLGQLALTDGKSIAAWQQAELARSEFKPISDPSPRIQRELAPYWFVKDRFLWASTRARAASDAASRRLWAQRETAVLFEMTDLIERVERSLGPEWRNRLSDDWQAYRLRIEWALAQEGQALLAARLLPMPEVASSAFPPAPEPLPLSQLGAMVPPESTLNPLTSAKAPAKADKTSTAGAQKSPPKDRADIDFGLFWLLIAAAFLLSLGVFVAFRRRAPALPDMSQTKLEQRLSPDRGPSAEPLRAEVLARLLRDIDNADRRQWSQHLARKSDAPNYLVRALAEDEIGVALPVLTLSPALTEPDLCAIAETASQAHRRAIAMRPGLQAAVIGALLRNGDEEVARVLLENSDIRFDSATLAALIDTAARFPGLSGPLVRRSEVDLEIARQLYYRASSELRAAIVARFGHDAMIVEPGLDQAVLDEKPKADLTPSSAEAAVTQDLLLDALQAGHRSLFLALFKQWSGLGTGQIERILFGGDGEELAIACRALDIDRARFPRLFLLVRRSGEEHGQLSAEPAALARALAVFDSLPQSRARDYLERWRAEAESKGRTTL
jgi:uncharacterized protein (DUF2336 family)